MPTTVVKILTLSWEIYELFRSSHRMSFMKNAVLKISQYSQESCRPASLLKRDSNTGVFL